MLIRPDMFVVYCIMHIVICVVHYNSSLDVFLSWIQMVLTMLSHSDTLSCILITIQILDTYYIGVIAFDGVFKLTF